MTKVPGAALLRLLVTLSAATSPAWSQTGPPEADMTGIAQAATLSWPGYNNFAPQPPVGGAVTIFGRNLASQAVSAQTFPLPTELGGVQVLFGGRPSHLLYASPSQVNLLVPGIGPGGGTGPIEIRNRFGSVQFAPGIGGVGFNPGLFTADGSGCGVPAIYNHRLARIQQPREVVRPGDVLTMYGTGFGPPFLVDGNPTPSDPLFPAPDQYRYQFLYCSETAPSPVAGETLWQGKAPGLVGVDQLNVRIPDTVQRGCAVSVRPNNPVLGAAFAENLLPFPLAISDDGVSCQDKAREGFLRLVVVREVNSAVPGLPERRDRLFGGLLCRAAAGPGRPAHRVFLWFLQGRRQRAPFLRAGVPRVGWSG